MLLSGAEYDPVAFIDDKKSLHGSSINGVRVYGSDVLPKLVRQHRIDRVLLAMPATTAAAPARDPRRSWSRWACACSRCRACPT